MSVRLAATAASVLAATQAAMVPGRWFNRTVTVVMENAAFDKVLADKNYGDIAKTGTLLTQYYAATHPSYPNYISMTAGDILVYGDTQKTLNVSHIGDLLEAKGVSWAQYAENFPGDCNLESTGPDAYARRHTPFLSYANVQTPKSRCNAHVFDDKQFWKDVAANTVPQYAFFTPNCQDDGHNTGIAFGGNWLANFISKLTADKAFMEGTLLVVTFDEDDGKYQNNVYTMLIGDMVAKGAKDDTKYDVGHYSLLRTWEDNWSLGNLGRKDATATPIKIGS